MKLKELSELLNNFVEKGHWEEIVCMENNNHIPLVWEIICSTPILELDTVYFWFDWDHWKMFFIFKENWEERHYA